MKIDIKFTVNTLDRAFSEEATKTTEGRIDIERQRLEDELDQLQQVEDQIADRIALINRHITFLIRIAQ